MNTMFGKGEDQMNQELIESLEKTWGVKWNEEPKPLKQFLKELDITKPAYGYAVSTVERNMFSGSTRARAVKAGIDPENELIQKTIAEKLRKTPYTRWSGD